MVFHVYFKAMSTNLYNILNIHDFNFYLIISNKEILIHYN